MADAQLTLALQTMGRDPDTDGELLAGSASGSGVYRVRSDPTDAVLKVTTDGRWRSAARRELRCYRELAGRLPVRMPRLLDWVDTDAVTAMLLSAHRPAAPANDWTLAEWLEVAEQLGALHTTPERLDGADLHWLLGALSRPHDAAASYWRQTDAGAIARSLFAALPPLADAITVSPTCFMHGDCHVGNLLRDDDGTLVWTDWQGVGVGYGEAELAFLWGRAETDVAELPREAMLTRYAAVRGIDIAAATRATVAAELSTLLVAWPEYAGWNSPEQRDRKTRRLVELAAEWDA